MRRVEPSRWISGGDLKLFPSSAETEPAMTASNPALREWASHPMGKAARVGIAAAGMITATILLTVSPLASNGSWAVILTGLALTATSIRAALIPTPQRMSLLAAVAIAIPVVTQLL